jgi:hypothetical protein
MKNNNPRINELPLCQFGPGGDFVQSWHGQPPEPSVSVPSSPLNRVLTTIAELLAVTVQPEILAEIACVLPPETSENPSEMPALCTKETENHAPNSRADTNHASSIECIEPNRNLPKQTMLFGDDWGTGRGAKRKSSNGVRAHRRTSRKKVNCAIQRQGTLFTVNGTGKTPHRHGSAA